LTGENRLIVQRRRIVIREKESLIYLVAILCVMDDVDDFVLTSPPGSPLETSSPMNFDSPSSSPLQNEQPQQPQQPQQQQTLQQQRRSRLDALTGHQSNDTTAKAPTSRSTLNKFVADSESEQGMFLKRKKVVQPRSLH